jgi:hypothetical protein
MVTYSTMESLSFLTAGEPSAASASQARYETINDIIFSDTSANVSSGTLHKYFAHLSRQSMFFI